MTHLSNPIFHDETPLANGSRHGSGPMARSARTAVLQKSLGFMAKAHRPGLFQCNDCREQFTVTVNTVCERSKIPLSKWCMAIYLLNSSKKGMSALQMHRMMGGSYKTAWFMMHRIREAMREGKLGPLGGEGNSSKPTKPSSAAKPKNRAYRDPSNERSRYGAR